MESDVMVMQKLNKIFGNIDVSNFVSDYMSSVMEKMKQYKDREDLSYVREE